MNITVSLDDEKFAKTFQEGFESIPKETIAEILKDALVEFMHTPANLYDLLFIKHDYNRHSLRDWITEPLKSAFEEEAMKPIRKKMVDIAQDEQTVKEMLQSAIIEVFARQLFDADTKSNFQMAISQSIWEHTQSYNHEKNY